MVGGPAVAELYYWLWRLNWTIEWIGGSEKRKEKLTQNRVFISKWLLIKIVPFGYIPGVYPFILLVW